MNYFLFKTCTICFKVQFPTRNCINLYGVPEHICYANIFKKVCLEPNKHSKINLNKHNNIIQ